MKKRILILIFVLVQCGLFAQTKVDFSESEIALKTSSGYLYGTVTIPVNIKTSPIVIIIPGSGAPDRNGNCAPIGLHTNNFKMLSESFAENGISTLRFDKRGAGKSKPTVTSESELSFENYVDDVIGWISLLKTDIRFSKIIILGHSEGSLIGMIAARQTNIASFISVAGSGMSADKLLQAQLKNLPPQLLSESNKIIDSLKVGKTVSKVNPNLLSLFRPSLQPYLISWIKYDPANEITDLKIPTLIIQGTTDLQISVDDAKLLSEAKPDAKLVIINNMNHVLKESDSDIKNNIATYGNPNLPLKSELVEEIVNFIKTK